jgi:Ca2+-binding RTX toxin-like protein
MKRLLGIGVVVMAVFGGFAVPSAAAFCTLKGTQHGDFLSGTDVRDVICAHDGNDYVTGQDGRDLVRGGPGNDTVVGGKGADRILGRGGADKLFAIDGHPNDVLIGGDGTDHCYGEKGDRYRGCEQVVTNNSPTYPLKAAIALSKAMERTVARANRRICNLSDLFCILS